MSNQDRHKDALQVLGRAIEELNTDLVYAKKLRSGSIGSAGTSSTPPGGSSGQVVEFDHLKKMKALCHRRLGSVVIVVVIHILVRLLTDCGWFVCLVDVQVSLQVVMSLP